ncbi:hypothetical protein ACV8AW_000804 [Escherichia coli]
MSNIDKQALNQEKIECLNKLADMEYCKSNPGHWLMSLKDTNMLAKLALRSVALLDELEAAEKRNERALELLSSADSENVWEIIGRLKVVISGDYRSEAETAAAAGKGE